ncbi:site-2 protease family protein [Carboxylicivirga sp. RSCT41]|uniref:site-2 protease family protein n=1 Tax=Carboxylicivirga agarovorans TaxID=3417570 RepID=UPI003D35279E
MIFIAIIIYALFNLMPKLILKQKYNQLEQNFSWKIPIMKLSGLVLSFLLAFLLTFGATISSKDRFIENKNAIYGLEFNNVMEEIGFRDSMKIISINSQEIGRVTDILKTILLTGGEIEVIVEEDGIKSKITITESDIVSIINSSDSRAIIPIMYGSNGKNKIIVSTEDYKFSDVLFSYRMLWKQAIKLINPFLSSAQEQGGFVSISMIKSLKGYLFVISLNLLVIGIINLLPLPGFSIGNLLISIIENLRKKTYNKRRKRIFSWISIFLLVMVSVISLL